MMSCVKVEFDNDEIADVKSEQTFAMLSQYNYVFENVDYPNIEKLKFLKNLINSSTNTSHLIEYYSKRATIFYEMKNWEDVLTNIQKSKIHDQMSKIRDAMKDCVNKQVLDNIDFMTLLNSITYEHVEEFIKKRKQTKQGSNKRLKKE
ncbi:unnamed protein product [Rotaria socialis]